MIPCKTLPIRPIIRDELILQYINTLQYDTIELIKENINTACTLQYIALLILLP